MTTEIAAAQPSVDSVLEKTLHDIDIPPRPVILERISAEMVKDEPDFKHLAHLINADASLTAGLIKTANSPFFGFRTRARSANDALTMLGLNVASRAIAGISLRTAFPSNPKLDVFWNNSARVAALSGWLAQIVEKPKLRADDAYTFGLFRDCGVPVLFKRFPVYWETHTRAAKEAERPFVDVEQEDYPTNHAMVGCLMGQKWWLPEEICLAIRHHHNGNAIDLLDSGLPLLSRYFVAVSHTAEFVFQKISGRNITNEWPKLGSACLRVLDLSENDLTPLLKEATQIVKTVE